MKKLFTWLRLRWRHRSHVPLYPDVWRRPDGVCVNDAGRVWDEFWQQPEGPEKNRSRIGWAAFVAVVWGLALGVNPARADFPTQVFFYATTNFNGMSGEAEACWSVYDDNQAPCMAVPWYVHPVTNGWSQAYLQTGRSGVLSSLTLDALGVLPVGVYLTVRHVGSSPAWTVGTTNHNPTAPLLYPVYAKVKQPDGSYKIKIVKVIAK